MIEPSELREPSGYHTQIDSNNSAILIVPNAPSHLEIGIDCMSYETGPKFVGISLIPPGLHFLHFGVGMGSKQGFFFVAKRGELIVRPWNSAEEEISSTNTLSDESTHQLQISLHRGDLNASIGPYPLSQTHLWKNLTAFISERVLKRSHCELNTPILPTEYDLCQLSLNPDTLGTYFVDIAAAEDVLIQNMSDGSSNRTGITRLGLDKSLLVDYLVENEYERSLYNLLGELQLSFVLFMLLFSYPGLNQWKKIVDTLCKCETLLLSNADFATAFLRIFYEQLNFSPSDFFSTELSKDNFLCPAVSSLFSILSADDVPVALKEHRKRLFAFMQKKFGLFDGSSILGTGVDLLTLQNSPFIDKFNLVAEDVPILVDSSELQGYFLDASEVREDTLSDDSAGIQPPGDQKLLGGRVRRGDSAKDCVSTPSPAHRKWDEIDAALRLSREESMDGSSSRSQIAAVDSRAWSEVKVFGADGTVEAFDDSCSSSSSSGDVTAKSMVGGSDSKDAALKQKQFEDSAAGASVMDGVCVADELDAEAAPQPLPPMSPAEKEAAMYSWRYPLLFDAMQAAQGREDMVMTAMRLLDESEEEYDNLPTPPLAATDGADLDDRSSKSRVGKKLTMLQMESLRFVQDEVRLMGIMEE